MLLLFRHSSLLLVAALAAIVTACSNDDSPADKAMRADGKVPVRLRLSVAGEDRASSALTRAPWEDDNATDDEMMNVWTVVAVHAEDDTESPKRFEAGDIAFIHASMPEAAKREIDDFVYLYPGKYDFYNFANMEPKVVTDILGIGDTEKFLTPVNADGTLGERIGFPYGFFSKLGEDYTGTLDKNGVYSLTFPSVKIKLHDISGDTDTGVAGKTVTINGNGFDPNDFDPDNNTHNGFDSKGIPMSNYQQLTVTEGNTFDLIVVRMLAKVEVQMFNEAPADPQHPLKVTSVSLTSVTANGVTNLMLLPSLTHRDDMEADHKDIQPNLYGTPNQVGYTYTVPEAKQQLGHAPYNNGNGTPAQTLTFYVNESTTPTNASGLFFLTLKLEHTVGAGQNQTTVAEYTHALINQTGSSTTDDNGAWHYIARNDYRIIPVILTDWQFRIEPLAFVPIAGYPAKTLSSDALTATFSTGGPIILQPFVKKWNENTWRDFSDPNITYGVEVKNGDDEVDVTESWKASISWTNSDGTNKSGTGMILTQPLEYDPVSNCIVGVLNNDLPAGTYKTSVTVTVKLKDDGPAGNEYTYSYTCNIVLQK